MGETCHPSTSRRATTRPPAGGAERRRRLRRGPPRAGRVVGLRQVSTGWHWQATEAAARQQEGITSPDIDHLRPPPSGALTTVGKVLVSLAQHSRSVFTPKRSLLRSQRCPRALVTPGGPCRGHRPRSWASRVSQDHRVRPRTSEFRRPTRGRSGSRRGEPYGERNHAIWCVWELLRRSCSKHRSR
jgi:hypothetical protein